MWFLPGAPAPNRHDHHRLPARGGLRLGRPPVTARPLLIGLSARIYHPAQAATPPSGVWTRTLHYLEQSVAHWVMSGGAVPVMVPALDEHCPPAGCAVRAADFAAALDGLLLQGGNDVAPEHYDEDPLHDDWRGDALRDRCEMALVDAFVAAGKPVFGICRGLQLLNVHFGGTLLQDIGTQRPEALAHRDEQAYEQHRHPVCIEPGTRLAALYPGLGPVLANSIHHQGIKQLAPGFVVEARCPDDGMVEAIRHIGPAWVAAVQWHPEFHAPGDAGSFDDRALLADFLAAALTARGTAVAPLALLAR